MSYLAHSLEGEVLPLCREAVSVFYSPSWLAHFDSLDKKLCTFFLVWDITLVEICCDLYFLLSVNSSLTEFECFLKDWIWTGWKPDGWWGLEGITYQNKTLLIHICIVWALTYVLYESKNYLMYICLFLHRHMNSPTWTVMIFIWFKSLWVVYVYGIEIPLLGVG